MALKLYVVQDEYRADLELLEICSYDGVLDRIERSAKRLGQDGTIDWSKLSGRVLDMQHGQMTSLAEFMVGVDEGSSLGEMTIICKEVDRT